MNGKKKFVVSHAPHWHDGRRLPIKNYNIMLAALPAVIMGIYRFGLPALAVVAFSMGTAMMWEFIFCKISRRPVSIGNANAAVVGLMFAMLLPATVPWWFVITGTFVAMILGVMIFGGQGGNPFSPAGLALAVVTISWGNYVNFDYMLEGYNLPFDMAYPLAQLKFMGVDAAARFKPMELLMAQQSGGIGSVFGLGLIIGGAYLMLRGYIRWEIVISYLVGVAVTAWIFSAVHPDQYAGPVFHLLTGYTLVTAFFLLPEDSSSPVNFVPMIICGLLGGLLTVLIRNIGVFVDGAIPALLLVNVSQPLIDNIRPKALGKVASNA